MLFPAKLNLENYSVHNLNYLRHGDTTQDEAEDAARFQAWKACLGKTIDNNNINS
jgi:dachs protein